MTPSRKTATLQISASSLPTIPGPLKSEYKSFDYKPTTVLVATSKLPRTRAELVPTKGEVRGTVPTVAVDGMESPKTEKDENDENRRESSKLGNASKRDRKGRKLVPGEKSLKLNFSEENIRSKF